MDAIQMSEGRSADFLHQKAIEWLRSESQTATTPQIIDFGAGQGILTRRLTEALPGAHVLAIDAMQQPSWIRSGASVSWVVHDLNQPLAESKIRPGSIDLLLAIEVIEHLENPRFQLRQWFQFLKPGGKLLFSTPNVESLRSLLSLYFRGHFVDFLDSNYPAHITPLIATDALRVTREAGFKDVQLRYSNQGTLPVFTSLTWQSISLGWLSGRRFSDQIFISATK